MAYFLIVVEGPHDAAFIGRLLAENGLTKVRLRNSVDDYWAPLIPTQFPANPQGRLDHVVRFPDIYETADPHLTSVAIAVAGGDSRLIPEVQASLEILDVALLGGVALVSDADDIGVDARFQRLNDGLNRVNAESVADELRGFPLILPPAAGSVSAGAPRVGIHIFPDNKHEGTLERVLLECGKTSYAPYCDPAIEFVNTIDASRPQNVAELENLRAGSGRDKAAAATVGGILFPGSSLAVSIEQGSWLNPLSGTEVGVASARSFLAQFLGTPLAE
jgi:hypothetical protein